MSDNTYIPENEHREFHENPYDPERKRPEDLVRLFYVHNVPIIPVVSKRNRLLGVLKKETVISELSDIGRTEGMKIDVFITGLADRMTLDELLPYGEYREFTVINIFGEVQGKWSRLQLFAASEPGFVPEAGDDVSEQREEQVLEWMIYLILEHIPRALYALNSEGKTLFYNSHFEDMYRNSMNGDVDAEFVEKSIGDADSNEILPDSKDGEVRFFNRVLSVTYEKVPLVSKRKRVGFLIYCLGDVDREAFFLDSKTSGKSLKSKMDAMERQILVQSISETGDIDRAAKSLQLTRKTLMGKIRKHAIEIPGK